jgi:hypothetical protein
LRAGFLTSAASRGASIFKIDGRESPPLLLGASVELQTTNALFASILWRTRAGFGAWTSRVLTELTIRL